jgi:hypothetical protein
MKRQELSGKKQDIKRGNKVETLGLEKYNNQEFKIH